MDQNAYKLNATEDLGPISYKKNVLSCHVPFILQMIDKVKGTEFEEKWKLMHECIISDKKKMTIEQITKINLTVNKMKAQAELAEQKQNKPESTKKTPESNVSVLQVELTKPKNLEKPPLTTDDLQQLIQDLSKNIDVQQNQPVKYEQPIPKKQKLPNALETKSKRRKPASRLPSSWVPSKTATYSVDADNDKKEKLSTMNSVSKPPGKPMLKIPSEIPKINFSQSLSPSTSTTGLSSNISLKQSLIADAENKPGYGKITLSNLDFLKSSGNNDRKKSQIRFITPNQGCQTLPDFEKIKTSVETGESVDKKESNDLNTEASKAPNQIDYDRNSKDITSIKNCLLKVEEDVRKSNVSLADIGSVRIKPQEAVETANASFESSTSSHSHRSLNQNKELRRLHENIVKNDEPLPSRRSLKRASVTAMADKNNKNEMEEKQILKKIKSEPEIDQECAASSLPKATLEVLKKTPIRVRKTIQIEHQSIRKSTSSVRTYPAAIEKMSLPIKNNNPKSMSKAENSSQFDHTDDEEWEDIKVKSPSTSKHARVTKAIYKHTCNISYAMVASETLFKCLLNGCKFETDTKVFFAKHLESRHAKCSWNGYCNICNRTVWPCSNDGHSIIVEFIHMIETHLQNESPPQESPSIIDSSQTTTETEDNVEIDADIMKNIDSILNELTGNSDNNSEEVAQKPANTKQLTTSTSSSENTSHPNSTTKIISSNIVGRVIPISQIPGLKLAFNPSNKIITNSSANNLQNKTQHQNESAPTGASADTSVVNETKKPEEKIVKYVIQKPKIVPVHQEKGKSLAAKPALKVNATIQAQARNFKSTPSTIKPLPEPNSIAGVEAIRPWLHGLSQNKLHSAATQMLSSYALTATFKCMASTCSFFTSDFQLFLKHLTYHEQWTPDDRKNFLACANCEHVCDPQDKPDELVFHIVKSHQFDKYQCSYCFYRSCADFNVLNHLNSFHKMKPKMVLECELKEQRDYRLELQQVKLKRGDYVPPIICVFCRSVFYVFKTFLTHINEHTNVLNTKCIKCGEKATKGTLHKHLIQCHGFGLFQCVYCRFGTNTFEIISNHIANKHPSKMPLFCERSGRKNRLDDVTIYPPESIESTCLKHINQPINLDAITRPPRNEAMSRNLGNVGRLSSTIHIRDNSLGLNLSPHQQILPSASKATPIQVNTKIVNDSNRVVKRGRYLLPSAAKQKHQRKSLILPNTPNPKPISPQIGKSLEKTKEILKKEIDDTIRTQLNKEKLSIDPSVQKQPSNQVTGSSANNESPANSTEKPTGLQIQHVYSLSKSLSDPADDDAWSAEEDVANNLNNESDLDF